MAAAHLAVDQLEGDAGLEHLLAEALEIAGGPNTQVG